MYARIQLTDRAENDLTKLDSTVAKRIAHKLQEIGESGNPMYFAKALTGSFKGRYRFRIGDYRAIFRKESDGTITILLILRVQHRKDIYE